MEGFGNIVVSPLLQSHDRIHLVTAGSEKENGNLTSCADGTADFISGAVRQHKIQKAEVKRRLSLKKGERFFDSGAGNGVVPFLYQGIVQSFKDDFVILHNPYGHIGTSIDPSLVHLWLL